MNDAHSPARQESDLHHEAAHLIRGHRPSRLLQIDGLTLREYDSDAESEAEWLAGCLHLPRAVLLRAVRHGEDDSTIGQKFLASAEMVRSGDPSPESIGNWPSKADGTEAQNPPGP